MTIEELDEQTTELLPAREVMQSWSGSGRGKSWTYHSEDNDRVLSNNSFLNGNSITVGDVASNNGNVVDSFNGSGNIVTTLLFGGGRKH